MNLGLTCIDGYSIALTILNPSNPLTAKKHKARATRTLRRSTFSRNRQPTVLPRGLRRHVHLGLDHDRALPDLVSQSVCQSTLEFCYIYCTLNWPLLLDLLLPLVPSRSFARA